MRKYYQLLLVVVCTVSVITLLVYRHEYNRLRYVLQVLNFFGTPGLTDSDLCNAGFNASHLTALIRNSSSETLDVYPIFQRIDDSFFAYSSFLRRNYGRIDLDVNSQFSSVTDTLVLGKNNVEPNFSCHVWFEERESPVFGKFSFMKIAKDKQKTSRSDDIYVFHCKLKRDFGTPTGVSYYPNYAEVNPLHSTVHRLLDISTKVSDSNNIGNIRFVNKFYLVMCVSPNQIAHVSKNSIIEFLSFHQKMGVNEFIIYDSSLPPDVTKKLFVLADDVIGAKIRFFPMNFPFYSNTSYSLLRDIVEIDCLYRNFKLNKDLYDKTSHIVSLSWDEYIVPRYHHTFKSLLNDYDSPRRVKQAELSTLKFCLNQRDDPKTKPNYPQIIKKTHFDKTWTNDRHIYVRSVGILSLDDILPKDDDFSKTNTVKYNDKMSSKIVAVHKYADCVDGKQTRLHGNDNMAYAEFELHPHQFEGSMIKFAEDVYNSKLYTMYRIGKIWKANDN